MNLTAMKAGYIWGSLLLSLTFGKDNPKKWKFGPTFTSDMTRRAISHTF
jgi:hypothetical protein